MHGTELNISNWFNHRNIFCYFRMLEIRTQKKTEDFDDKRKRKNTKFVRRVKWKLFVQPLLVLFLVLFEANQIFLHNVYAKNMTEIAPSDACEPPCRSDEVCAVINQTSGAQCVPCAQVCSNSSSGSNNFGIDCDEFCPGTENSFPFLLGSRNSFPFEHQKQRKCLANKNSILFNFVFSGFLHEFGFPFCP